MERFRGLIATPTCDIVRPMPVSSREAAKADSARVAPESNARRWTVVGLLCLGIIIAYVDRTNFSVALAAKVGPAIGAWIAAILLTHYGWKPMFLILGLGSMVWLLPWQLLVKNDDRQIEQATKPTAATHVPFGRIMASPVIWGTIIGTF